MPEYWGLVHDNSVFLMNYPHYKEWHTDTMRYLTLLAREMSEPGAGVFLHVCGVHDGNSVGVFLYMCAGVCMLVHVCWLLLCACVCL